jgi:hypothetical protein
MLCVMEVFGCVLVFRRIAAADVAALQAQTQVDPGVTCLDTVFANARLCVRELDLVEMRALRHRFSPWWESRTGNEKD